MPNHKWLWAACVACAALGIMVGVWGPHFLPTNSTPTNSQSSTDDSAEQQGRSSGTQQANRRTPAVPPSDWQAELGRQPQWVEVTATCGIDFRHTNGMSGNYEYLEMMGGGVAVFDYDGDGDLDLYLVNGNRIDAPPDPTITNRLYRNDGNLRFVDVTQSAGVGDAGYGQGCAAADFDEDGDLDLYVTNHGPNVLYRNNGDGTFTDWTQQAGVGDSGWGQSVCFCDVDNDGHLDLYTQNYLQFGSTRGVEAFINVGTQRVPDYPSPLGFTGASDRLYRNLGDGTFEDVTAQAGIGNEAGKGMGLACADLTGDRLPDIFVANDTMANFLFRNLGGGRFEEVGRTSGVAYSLAGIPEASMGVDIADYDVDGDLDLIVPCLTRQFFTLYRNEGRSFADVAGMSGMAKATAGATGFDAHFLDYDNDADLDLFFTCGGVRRNDDAGVGADYNQQYGMQDLLLANDGRGFYTNVSRWAGDYFGRKLIGRGSVAADLDNDGDHDLVISNLADRLVVLRNDVTGNHWLTLELVDRQGRKNPNGTHVWLTTPSGQRQHWVTHPGTTYLSQSDRRPHFGLGSEGGAPGLEIRWPDGGTQRVSGVGSDRFVVIEQTGEGEGE